MDKRESDILIKIDKILAEDGGARVAHDFVDGLASEMETLTAEADRLRFELASAIAEKTGLKIEIDDSTLAPAKDIREYIASLVGANRQLPETPPELDKAFQAIRPDLVAALRKLDATGRLIDRVVERMYGIPRPP